MGRLIYSAIASLDGYVEDADGGFGWAAPDEEVFACVNELERPIGICLYGRRMYETLAAWETMGRDGDEPAVIREFGEIWRAAEKVVYSRSLREAASARTRIEREFEPAAVEGMKASSERDMTVGGAELAGQALAAGLVDECQLFLCPVLVGGGKRALPDGVGARLELLGERRFGGGVVLLRYALGG